MKTMAGTLHVGIPVPERSFRHGVASIVDVPGKLAVFRMGRRLFRTNNTSAFAAIRSDQRRIAGDFAVVASPRISRLRVEEMMTSISK